MKDAVMLKRIIKELQENAEKINEDELNNFAQKIMEAKRLFVAGAGRSGFVARAFSNRLMHLGMTVWFVGEPTTPAIGKDDLLIILSGSGETGSLKVMAQKAKEKEATVAIITIYPESTIGKACETLIQVPGVTPKSNLKSGIKSVQPMGNAFEQMSWLICDNIIMIVMEKMNKTEVEMFSLHANLE